ncbi:MAG TPA: SIMPL domain-containing protein [Blastocatellia bacterium]|nr:SIMPL domain-containing protein [Blastocatellia bacterium]
MKRLLPFAIMTLLYAGAAAQEPAERMTPPSIRVSGDATVIVQPDQARIDIGVTTQAQTAQAAAADNAHRLETALAELRRALGSGAEIKTVNYTLNPDYHYPKEGGKPTITGYTATNIVRVTLNDLTRIGLAIDVATQSGANQVQRLQFTLKDEQAAQSQALRAAAVKAKAQAEALAQALGLKVGRVLSVVESSAGFQPVLRDVALARAEAAVSTPVEPGTIEVRAAITLTVEISAQ